MYSLKSIRSQFSLKSIRSQMYFGVGVLFCVVALLSLSGFQGAYSYRDLAIAIEQRADELPLATTLNQQVAKLQILHMLQIDQEKKLRQNRDNNRLRREPFRSPLNHGATPIEVHEDYSFRDDFHAIGFENQLTLVKVALDKYQTQLRKSAEANVRLADTSAEESQVKNIQGILNKIEIQTSNPIAWAFNEESEIEEDGGLTKSLNELVVETFKLPEFLSGHMKEVRDKTRADYHTWMAVSGFSTLAGIILILGVMERFKAWFFKPLLILVNGSRRVAAGDFDHRIQLKTNREVAELADAMNAMTARFQEIRDDLDHQVQQRTKEVVRSEQLASVGFLAAGVAHEINNPLASIAWSAESLESRLPEVIDPDCDFSAEEVAEEVELLKKYLKRIQEEAFRCKGITDSLLDFSRMGDVNKQPTELRELVIGVIDMIQHLGNYRDKKITFDCQKLTMVPVVAHEIKQVILNLLTNALDSVAVGGEVHLALSTDDGQVVLRVEDDGCGMTNEVLKHLFEPFFTRRRDGQGTGLGLSITYQIIADHGGDIHASSRGPGQGSEFQVTLPLEHYDEKTKRKLQAA